MSPQPSSVTPRDAVARQTVLARVADHLIAHRPGHPLRVAVDGITAAGKTTFARELTVAVAARGRPAVHLSTDDYHHPRAHRHRQGRDSAAGYYQDAYDLHALRELILAPLGPGGDGRYRPRRHDLATDELLDEPYLQAETDAVVIVDGSFLQRPELAAEWDEVIFLDTSLAAARARGIARDASAFGGSAAAAHAYEHRYHAAAQIYLAEFSPIDSATIVIGHDDPTRPKLQRIGGSAASTAQLFSYGALQQPQVQLASFGRLLAGVPDTLNGYCIEWLRVTDSQVIATSGSDRHPIVRASGSGDDIVTGTCFTVSATELASADTYEVPDYRRVLLTLGSGRPAWVYLEAS